MGKKFLLIGLTGGTGSGKTLVSDVFSSRGIPSIEGDRLARAVVEPGRPALDELVEYFGADILDESGALKRRELANIAFSDPDKLKMLNRITHHHIGILSNELMEKYKSEGCLGVLYDAPVLIESGLNKKCDFVVCVLADVETRTRRIMQRDALTLEETKRRIGVQQSDEFYIEHSDYVIYNNDDPYDAKRRANEVIDKILSEVNAFE